MIRSKFYYGYVVTDDNKYIPFSEGASNYIAIMKNGSYTLTEFVGEIERAMNVTGALLYTVSVNRTDRKITFSAPSNFTLKVTSGGSSTIYSPAGFTGADRTGASTYTGNLGSGTEYKPQFPLQSLVDKDDFNMAVESSVITAADGTVEVVKFGDASFYEFEIKYATNLSVDGTIIESGTGHNDLVNFMKFAITKAPFEFMKDRSTPSTFDKVMLDKTSESDKGVGYKLKEIYDKGLPGFFESGVLKLRVFK
jgi:hypothetical protein